jgi:hypothetical protein
VVAVGVGLWAAVRGVPGALLAEDGPLEVFEAVAWFACAATAFGLGWRTPDARGKWGVALLGVLATLAGLRELDAHVHFNPETLGAWGVRYRWDWWTSAQSPVGPRVLWGAIGLLVAAALIVPMVKARAQPLRQLRSGHPGTWLFCLAGGALATGWVLDDVLRGMLSKEPAKLAEELAELVGVSLYFACVVASIADPPARDQRVPSILGRTVA